MFGQLTLDSPAHTVSLFSFSLHISNCGRCNCSCCSWSSSKLGQSGGQSNVNVIPHVSPEGKSSGTRSGKHIVQVMGLFVSIHFHGKWYVRGRRWPHCRTTPANILTWKLSTSISTWSTTWKLKKHFVLLEQHVIRMVSFQNNMRISVMCLGTLH
jgi:hypothetical protein